MQSLVILCHHFSEDTKKFTKIYNAHALPLFCSLNLLFSYILVAIAVMVFLNSLLTLEHHMTNFLAYLVENFATER